MSAVIQCLRTEAVGDNWPFILLFKQAHAYTHALALARGEKSCFHKRCSVRPQGRCPSAWRGQVTRLVALAPSGVAEWSLCARRPDGQACPTTGSSETQHTSTNA